MEIFELHSRSVLLPQQRLLAVAAKMKDAMFHELHGADHSFAVLKSSSRTREDVWTEAVDVTLSWVDGFVR